MIRNAKSPTSDQIDPLSVDTGAAPESLIVAITNIQRYERNPRQGRNPEYDRIKDSIRNHGLDQPLVITQRPGAENYIVQAGGNTRLLVLKELYEETGDERFLRIPCMFSPWKCESDVLLAHLRENDLRGSLTFIDKARAVLDVRQLIAEDQGIGEISLRRLETELGRAGYRIANSVLCLMTYVVETLMEWIPKALEAGMGRHQIARIRALERAARKLWGRHCSENESAFDEVFATLCRRYDGPDWDTDLLQVALENEIAEEAETSVHTVRAALEAELKGREVVIPAFVPIKEPPVTNQHNEANVSTTSSEVIDDDDKGDTGDNQVEVFPDPEENTNIQPQGESNDTTADVSGSLIDSGNSSPADLKSLRSRAWTLAARLAQRNGIGDLVEPLSGKGLGFVLRDVPDPVLADQLDEDTLAQICMLWWQLAACAEMTYAPLESVIPLLPEDSILRQALANEDADLLFSSIWTLDPGHTGYRLWRPLHDRDWQDLLNLMDTYRRIRRLAAETGTAIWE